jgi:hypothetical protein
MSAIRKQVDTLVDTDSWRKVSTDSLVICSPLSENPVKQRVSTSVIATYSPMSWLFQLTQRFQQHTMNHNQGFPDKWSFFSPSVVTSDYFSTWPRNDIEDYSDKKPPRIADSSINGCSVPPQSVANKLVKTYLTQIHPFLPVFESSSFLLRYRYYLRDPSVQPGLHWLALLHFIFAAAAFYLGLQGQRGTDVGDHLAFASHASRLLQRGCSLDAATLEEVQVYVVGVFYYLATHQLQQ